MTVSYLENRVITCPICKEDKPVTVSIQSNEQARYEQKNKQTKCDHCGEVLDYANAI